MTFVDKAREIYARERGDYYASKLEEEMERFNELLDIMYEEGKCQGINCLYCPIHMAIATGLNIGPCSDITQEDFIKICSMQM